jgi:uncharacterized protein (TIGR03435 family)
MSRFTFTRLAQLVVLSAGLLSMRTYVDAQELGQAVESPPAFEAASLRLNTGSPPHFYYGPDRIEMRNVPLKTLICRAYRVSVWSLSGPDWLASVVLDFVATLPASAAELSPTDRSSMTNLMLQGLLAERFNLKVHREEKAIPGYALVVAPGGPKMRRVEALRSGGMVAAGSITSMSSPIEQIVTSVAGTLGRPVKDMTGLSGYYEFNLTWTPEDKVLAGADNTSTAPDDRPPSIFTALQEQLGLRLEPRKFPTQTVVVDHVERVPTEN